MGLGRVVLTGLAKTIRGLGCTAISMKMVKQTALHSITMLPELVDSGERM